MLGWINDCIENLVIDKFGRDAWHTVKEKAGSQVKDGGFYKMEKYSDQSTIDLVMAASQVSGLSVDQVLYAFGCFFIHYMRGQGYESLLCCQGRTLRDWMTKINAIHHHLQTTFPNKMAMPQFWCENNVNRDGCEDGSLLLHYYSSRGSLLASVAQGIVEETAKVQFGFDIKMEKVQTQGEEGSKFTSWHVTTVNPDDLWKLKEAEGVGDKDTTASSMPVRCPFTGATAEMHGQCGRGTAHESSSPHGTCPGSEGMKESKLAGLLGEKKKVSRRVSSESLTSSVASTQMTAEVSVDLSAQSNSSSNSTDPGVGLSSAVTRTLFPYHVVVGQEFQGIQLGRDLPHLLKTTKACLIGEDIFKIFHIIEPLSAKWDWDWLYRLKEEVFLIRPLSRETCHLRFKTSVVPIAKSPLNAMLVLTPDANSLEELRGMNLTINDLPMHGSHRDAVLLREHLSTQLNNALNMEKLTKSLETEKELLESLIPEHAAQSLRSGKKVQPMMHDRVTMLFCDIVGFTKMCKQIYPWEVVRMLNRLYCVMDFLAEKFNLFKVETIGDCYVACCGMHEENANHAVNVANFAIAVIHSCKQVASPLDDGNHIQLRIGIHTGECASGVVGTKNPRYCVFGDTVNTTARHESSGEAGKIHCSAITADELTSRAYGQFSVKQREGLVEMKGKGKLSTFWLQGCEENELVNMAALQQLDVQVRELLETTDFGTEYPNKERAISRVGKKIGLSNPSSNYFL